MKTTTIFALFAATASASIALPKAHAQIQKPVVSCDVHYYGGQHPDGPQVVFNGGIFIYRDQKGLWAAMSNNYDGASPLNCIFKKGPAQGVYVPTYVCKGKGWNFDKMDPNAPKGLLAELIVLPNGNYWLSTRVSKPYGGKFASFECVRRQN